MRIDMCIDMRIDLYRHVYRHVPALSTPQRSAILEHLPSQYASHEYQYPVPEIAAVGGSSTTRPPVQEQWKPPPAVASQHGAGEHRGVGEADGSAVGETDGSAVGGAVGSPVGGRYSVGGSVRFGADAFDAIDDDGLLGGIGDDALDTPDAAAVGSSTAAKKGIFERLVERVDALEDALDGVGGASCLGRAV